MTHLSVLIKPASSLCDLRCKYCFYADVADLRQVRSYGIMSADTAHILIERAVEAVNGSGNITFSFQGGEPLMTGFEFFTDFIAYTQQFIDRSNGKLHVFYSLQTNGMRIDESWAELFSAHRFLIGLSIDGDETVHNRSRVDSGRQGTWTKAMKAAKLLQSRAVDFNILSVITAQNAKQPKRLWDFYQSNGFRFVQLIPCLAPLESPEFQADYSLTPQLYGDFLIRFFKIWTEQLQRGRYISVRLFDNLVRMASGQAPEQCGLLGDCAPQFVIEADGSVYPCDFYVLDEYRCGSVTESSFLTLRQSEPMKRFLTEGSRRLPQCLHCPFYTVCKGGCRRYRSLYFQKRNYCPYRAFLEHILPDLQTIAYAWKNMQ